MGILTPRSRSRQAGAPSGPALVSGEERRPQGRIYAIYSGKGGVGRTLVATSVAVLLRQHTRLPTLLVDLNLDLGGAEVYLDLEPERSVLHLLPVIDELTEVNLRNVTTAHASGVELLASPADAEQAELLNAEHVQAILDAARLCYGHIVLDLPPCLGATTVAALREADRVLYVLTPDTPALRALKVSLDFFARYDVVDPTRIELIVNRASRRSEIQPRDIQELTQLPIAGQVPAGFDAIQPMVNMGEVLHGPNAVRTPVGESLRELVRNLLKREVGGRVAV